jgi:hypothetical protein
MSRHIIAVTNGAATVVLWHGDPEGRREERQEEALVQEGEPSRRD